MLLEILPAHRKKEIGPLRQAARGQKGIIRHHRMRPDGAKNQIHQSRKRGKMDQILHQEGKGNGTNKRVEGLGTQGRHRRGARARAR